jgi:hypothetical protein
MKASLHRYRYALVAAAAGVAALAGGLLLPAAASAQAAGTPVTITASFAHSYVNAGSSDMLSGVATYTPPGGSPQPLVDTVLSITSPSEFNWPAISTTVTTAADGRFSYVTPTIPLAVAKVEFTVSSAATASLDAGQASASFNVNEYASITLFSGTLSAYRVLHFSACGGIPEPLADGGLLGPLEYQYSTSRRGPWKTLGTGTLEINGPCFLDTDGGTYPGKFTAPRASAYYRAYAPAVPGQMSAVSNVIHLQRYSTKITGFAISPRRVRRNGKVTVSGRLLQLTSRWLSDKGGTITIEYRYKNKTYTLKHRLTTNSAGMFRGVFVVPHSASWLAVYSGNHNHFATASTSIRITVR